MPVVFLDHSIVDLDSIPPLVAQGIKGGDISIGDSNIYITDYRKELAPLPQGAPVPTEPECAAKIKANGTYDGEPTRSARFCLQANEGRTAYLEIASASSSMIQIKATVWELPE